ANCPHAVTAASLAIASPSVTTGGLWTSGPSALVGSASAAGVMASAEPKIVVQLMAAIPTICRAVMACSSVRLVANGPPELPVARSSVFENAYLQTSSVKGSPSHDLGQAVVAGDVVGRVGRAGEHRVGPKEGLTHTTVKLDVDVPDGDLRVFALERLLVYRHVEDLAGFQRYLHRPPYRECAARGHQPSQSRTRRSDSGLAQQFDPVEGDRAADLVADFERATDHVGVARPPYRSSEGGTHEIFARRHCGRQRWHR